VDFPHASISYVEHYMDILGSYKATRATCCQGTTLAPKGLVPVTTVSNSSQQTFCHLKPQWTLDNCEAISTQVRGGEPPLMAPWKDCGANRALHLLEELLWLVQTPPFWQYKQAILAHLVCQLGETTSYTVPWCCNIRPNKRPFLADF
jgi:hypothetical protein